MLEFVRAMVRPALRLLLGGVLVSPVALTPASAQDRQVPGGESGEAATASAVWSRDAAGNVTVRASRLVDPLALDGRLDEEVYRTSPALKNFVQQEPQEGQPATEPTEAWVFFDDRNIYISVRCWYSPEGYIVANEMRRDHNNVIQNDNFVVTLDTFHDRRTGYFFQTNALGALREMQIASETVFVSNWNTVWDVRTQIIENGWTAEFAIPFKSLRYRGSGPQTWGINLRRITRWKNEVVFISPVPASYGIVGGQRFSTAATLAGLETPPLSHNLELKPYAISSVTGTRSAGRLDNDPSADAGIDVKYGLTKGLTADFTYNTDFAQVEEDEQQVNLTRFSLLFPEKRDFFLEGQGTFGFGTANVNAGGGNSVAPILFFSRRIGLSGTREVPILAGGRVTGRLGKYTVGAIAVRTRDDEEANAVATDFTVARVRRDILRKSSIGVIATHRAPTVSGHDTNQAFGADAALSFFQNVNFTGSYAVTRSPGETRDESSYAANFSYGADRYGLTMEHLFVGEGFNPEIGFLRRTAFRRSYGQARFSPRPRNTRLVRKYSYEASLDYISDPDNTPETREAQGAWRVTFSNGDTYSTEFTQSYELLREPFAISRSVTLAPGGYTFRGLAASYSLGPQRRVTGTVSFSRGSFYDGHRTDVSYNGRVEVNSRLAVEPRVSINWVDLSPGDFTNTLVSARTIVTMSPRAALSGLLQYNSSNSTFSSSLRYRWEYRPNSEIFVVYADGRDTSINGFPSLLNRTLAVKITRLFRL
jgi:hypothetical protein